MNASNRRSLKPMKALAPRAVACLALAACNAPTPPGFELPEGVDCSAKIARYRAVQDNDLSMGHVVQSVYNQIKKEIAAAENVCAAGRDVEAKSMIAASERRHGYPVDL
jgi:hypothetical protein